MIGLLSNEVFESSSSCICWKKVLIIHFKIIFYFYYIKIKIEYKLEENTMQINKIIKRYFIYCRKQQ